MGAVAAVAAALELTQRDGVRMLLATASPEGEPHLAEVDALERAAPSAVVATAWYCHQTAVNTAVNPHVAVLVRPGDGAGILLVGEVSGAQEVAMLDGWDPAIEERGPLPQVRRAFRIEIRGALPFGERAHEDTPL